MAKAVSYVCAAFGAVLALFSLALLSVDLSPPPASSEGSAAAPMGSGAMFDAIAHRYDVTNKVISLGSDEAWRRRLVASLALEPGDLVLDLATGTADVAIMLGRQTEAPTVRGVDPSARMLDHGREKVAAAGLSSKVSLELGDAQDLRGHPSSSFGKTCMSFGIRNVPDRVQALKEMARVTKAGGLVSILEFSEPSEGLLAPLARLFVAHVVPRLGVLMSGGARDEYVHLQNSIKGFPLPAAFEAEMRLAGLGDVKSTMVHPGGVYLYTSVVK
mmetsp:Transcript_59434/g.134544  ORF Transcript_59434/g.134544 Transcript_59434/m.134544 type:complete len:273 (+) Transcript_59434:192-1010(+)|eukprot:CAMPEP_0172582854 /NCGR_PEP_ID=MMETSP1068-20121228/2398_1 /TAXON_ID=35684 /ORGANISM="Pseudopedinella elastica, Strain CCMP716" /LENGTH=272 /DNA_ID=CAMNT_0013376409 /DNA_START=117 /DNA_END=935 /DNA_ORIENTATION=-